MCNLTHNNSFGLGSTVFNEVHSHIVYIINNIFVFFYRWLYDIHFLGMNFPILLYFCLSVYFLILVLHRNFYGIQYQDLHILVCLNISFYFLFLVYLLIISYKITNIIYYNHLYNKTNILSSIKTTRLRTSLIAVNIKQNDLR